MRLQLLMSSLVVIGTACAPANRPSEIPPAAMEGGQRYQLVYMRLGSASVDQRVVDEVGVELQQELARKGLLLAAPWETPTLVVRFALRGTDQEGFDVRSGGMPLDASDGAMVQPISYSHSTSGCDGSKESMSHCSALDAPMPALPLSGAIARQRRSLRVEIRELAADRLIWANARTDDGEWTRARALRIRPLVQATLTQVSF